MISISYFSEVIPKTITLLKRYYCLLSTIMLKILIGKKKMSRKKSGGGQGFGPVFFDPRSYTQESPNGSTRSSKKVLGASFFIYSFFPFFLHPILC